MTFSELVTLVHDKSGDDALMSILDWWYEHSDSHLRTEVWECLEKQAYKITDSEAERLVKAMKPRGQNWSLKQVREYLATKGITEDCTYYYLVMNMAYNDYYSTAAMFGLQSDPEFFYSIAKDFIEDADAKPFKVEKYFMPAE